MSITEVVLFLDTNTLLHYPSIRETDWQEVANCAKVRLVLCLQVIHELDEKKDDSRIGDRAKQAIREIKSIRRDGGKVREDVVLEVFNHEIRVSDFPGTLSCDSSDDRIVYTIKKYCQQYSCSKVAVYTEDMGMCLRCEANGIATIEPDLNKRLPTPHDELTKKYKQAISELSDLKNKEPILKVVVCAKGLDAPEVKLLKLQIKGGYIERDLAREYDVYKSQHRPFSLAKQDYIGGVPVGRLLTYSDDSIRRYNAELEEHLQEYKEWLEESELIDRMEAYSVQFALWLMNTGLGPADDVDLTISVGDPVVYIYNPGAMDESQFVRRPAPSPPKGPRLLFEEVGLDIPTAISNAMNFNLPSMDRSILKKDVANIVANSNGNPHRIEYHSKRVKQHEPRHITDLVAVIRPTLVRPFQMKYRLTASNLPNPIEGEIAIVVQE